MLLIHRLSRFRTLESAGNYHIYRKNPKFRKLNTYEKSTHSSFQQAIMPCISYA